MESPRPSVTTLLAGLPGLSSLSSGLARGLSHVPGPGDLAQLAGRATGALEQAIDLVPRLVAVVGQVETLMGRVTDLMIRIERTDQRADELVRRTAAVIDGAEQVVGRTDTVIDRTDSVIDRADRAVRRTDTVLDDLTPLMERTGVVLGEAGQLVGHATPMLGALQPVLDRLLPILTRIADTTSPAEVDAVVRLIDQLPDLVGHLDADIVPILDTFGSVAPDVRDMLDIVRELNEMLASVPGMGKVKKRIEQEQAAEDEEAQRARYTADEIPPSAPARKELTGQDAAVDAAS